jgi:acyl-CoA thioesterase
MGMSLFLKQMALSPDGDGRYTVDVDARWNCPVVPHGGMMAAIAARAMQLELGAADQRLRTLTTVFAAQVPAGRVEVDVTVLRRGRSMSQALATVHAPGETAGHTTVAVFGATRPGFELVDVRRPDVPAPLDCSSFADPPPDGVEVDDEREFSVPFWDHVEGRAALGHAPWEDYVPTTSECAHWLRFNEPPWQDDGRLDPLAALALCDTMPSSVGERMGPGSPDFWGPSADFTVHVLSEPRSEWLLAVLRARRATDGYASIEAAMWDEGGDLVAHATQVMFLRFEGEVPSGALRFPADQR